MFLVFSMNNAKNKITLSFCRILFLKWLSYLKYLRNNEPESLLWTVIWHHPRTARPCLVCPQTRVWSHLPVFGIPRSGPCNPFSLFYCTSFPVSLMNKNVSSLFSPILFSNLQVLRPYHQHQPSRSFPKAPGPGFHCSLAPASIRHGVSLFSVSSPTA